MTDRTDVDSCIDEIVATCNGDLRGALKALMLVNEQLERELDRVTGLALSVAGRPRAIGVLH